MKNFFFECFNGKSPLFLVKTFLLSDSSTREWKQGCNTAVSFRIKGRKSQNDFSLSTIPLKKHLVKKKNDFFPISTLASKKDRKKNYFILLIRGNLTWCFLIQPLFVARAEIGKNITSFLEQFKTGKKIFRHFALQLDFDFFI